MKKTKIIATIGPSSDNKKTLKKLIDSGMNVARLNFSHGDYKSHQAKIDVLNELIKEGNNISIMLDTKGPEIRSGLFENNIATFKKGQRVDIYMKDMLGTSKAFSVSYKNLINDVKVNGIIKFDDGRLILKIVSKDMEKKVIHCKALNDHTMGNRKNCVIPLARPSMPYLSKKDKEDIIFGCKNNVDFIAASFARSKKDILDIKKLVAEHGHKEIQIIAKIESQEGLDNIDEILSVSDGVMVARGDLGVEIEPEEVPIAQRLIVAKAKELGKPVIVATHMLESMQHSPSPTRAEVSDVANAIYEAADGIMLSGETANGEYPVESTEMEARIAERIEPNIDAYQEAINAFNSSSRVPDDAIAYSVASSAIITNASLIIAFSNSGATSRRIAKYRPKCPVVSISKDPKVARLLNLNYGVYGYVGYYDQKTGNDKGLTDYVSKVAKAFGVKKNETVLITGGDGKGSTNFMKVIKIN